MAAVKELTLQKGAELDVTIESVSFGGEGIARVNDLVLFVGGAVTGDLVKIRILKIKKNFAEARAVEILSPSPFRTQARCKYFGTCGGCRWQDVDYPAQLEFKRRNIRDVFERIGGFRDVDVPQPIGSPKIYAYRNKMEFTFGDRPWLMSDGLLGTPAAAFALGLHVPKRFDKILDIDECHLQSPLANEILNTVKAFAESSGCPPYSVRTNDGFWRFLVIRETEHTHELMVNVITAGENEPVMRALKEKLIARFPRITCLLNGISARKSQVAVSDHERVLHGKDTIREKLGPFEFEISSASFFQTNTLAAEVLYRTLLTMADLKGNENVYDLYCGTGSIAIYLSPYARSVTGVELVEDAIANAEKNMRLNNVSNVRFVCGDIRTTLERLEDQPDVIVVDPPRSGLHPDVVEDILKLLPEKIVYVSCNPSTQARDLAVLCREAYALSAMQAVDMFPHTYHIENVAILVRNKTL